MSNLLAQAVVPAPRSGCDPAPGFQVPSKHRTRKIRGKRGSHSLGPGFWDRTKIQQDLTQFRTGLGNGGEGGASGEKMPRKVREDAVTRGADVRSSRTQSDPTPVLFCSSPDTGRISTAARSQLLRIARKGRKICGIN